MNNSIYKTPIPKADANTTQQRQQNSSSEAEALHESVVPMNVSQW